MTKQKTDAQLKADMDAKQRAKEAAAAKKAERQNALYAPAEQPSMDTSAEAQADGQDAFIPPAPVEALESEAQLEALLAKIVNTLKNTEVSLSALEKRVDVLEKSLKGLGVGAKRKVDDGTHVGSIDGLGQI